MKVEEFLNPNSMLTPGVAGGAIMMITNTVCSHFHLPGKWVALALSFIVGLLVVMNLTLPIWKRGVYYALNSLIIFSMAAGSNVIGAGASADTSDRKASVSQPTYAYGFQQPAIQIPAGVRHCSREEASRGICG